MAGSVSVADVVISYDSADRAIAEKIANGLISRGLTVWWDRHIQAGVRFNREIDRQLAAARAVIVLWSAASKDSDWVHDEAQLARDTNRLIPVRIDSTLPPLGFRQVQSLDMHDWNGDPNAAAFNALLSASQRHLGEGKPVNEPTPQVIPLRRKLASAWYVAGLAAVVIAVLAFFVVQSRVSSQATTDVDRGHANPGDATSSGRVTSEKDAGVVPFADRPAVAVLPFENRSVDPKDAIFADGLADDLITRLSSWRAFPVIARGSSFRYRGNVDLKRVGSELGARYVVQGSVQRAGDRIRISVQLVDTQSTQNLWSQTYDPGVVDVFAVQDEIGATVAASLVADLTRAESERAQQRGMKNLDAWGAYMLAVQRLLRLSPKDNAEARALAEQAQKLEPQSASVTALLATTYSNEVFFVWTDSPASSVEQALHWARLAVELDQASPDAHLALAEALTASGDMQNAIVSAERVIELNPSSPRGWSQIAWAKYLGGDPKAGIAAMEQAIRLDPQSDGTARYFELLSEAHFDEGQCEVGLEWARKLVAARPDFAWGYIDLAMNAVQFGRVDDARAAIVEARRLQPNVSQAFVQQGYVVVRPEFDARRNAALSRAGLD